MWPSRNGRWNIRRYSGFPTRLKIGSSALSLAIWRSFCGSQWGWGWAASMVVLHAGSMGSNAFPRHRRPCVTGWHGLQRRRRRDRLRAMPQRPPPSSPPSSTAAPTGSTPGSLETSLRQAWAALDWKTQDSATAQGVFVAFFALEAWRPWLDAMRTLLDAPESERVARKRRPRDADDLVLAYGLHRLVLGLATGCEARAVPRARDGLGRPCVRDETVQTSLSHADGAVAVAVARHGPV